MLALHLGSVDISFVIPTLDEEKYIVKTLDAIKAQKTKLKYEIIVVDGKSKDNTVKLAKKYGKVIIQKAKGIANARNLGAKAAKGEFVIFIDADTVIEPNYVSKVIGYLKKHPEVAGVTAKLDYDFSKFFWRVIWWFAERYIFIRSYFGKGRLTGINIAIRRDIFKKSGGFPEVPSEDMAFTAALWKFGKTKYLKGTVTHSSARRFNKEPLGILKYYIVRDLMTFTRTHKSKRFKNIERKIEKKIAKEAKYKEIR